MLGACDYIENQAKAEFQLNYNSENLQIILMDSLVNQPFFKIDSLKTEYASGAAAPTFSF